MKIKNVGTIIKESMNGVYRIILILGKEQENLVSCYCEFDGADELILISEYIFEENLEIMLDKYEEELRALIKGECLSGMDDSLHEIGDNVDTVLTYENIGTYNTVLEEIFLEEQAQRLTS